jgi:hypothetical protein
MMSRSFLYSIQPVMVFLSWNGLAYFLLAYINCSFFHTRRFFTLSVIMLVFNIYHSTPLLLLLEVLLLRRSDNNYQGTVDHCIHCSLLLINYLLEPCLLARY